LKLAMLTYSTRPRGGVVHALKLAERLKTLGADVTLYSLARSDDSASLGGYFRDVSIPFEIFPYEWSPELVTRLERMIAAYSSNLPRDSDIYHAQDCVGGTSLARMKAEGLISAPIFRTIHHIDDFAEPNLFEFEKKAVATADHRFVVSKYWKDALAREYGYSSIITYNGMDVSDFSKSDAREPTGPIVLFVGGLEPRKGLEHLIQAMEQVVRVMPEARLISVAKTGFRGTDEERWYRDLAARLGIADNVEFHESVSQETLLGFYSDCSLVVLPSKTEGWGLSLMEGMACGKPVVATKVGGIPELVRDGVDGILVEAGDEDALARSIIRLLGDPSLRKRMGDAGMERVAQFSWDETAKVALNAYTKALQAV
jgi:glycosyltransferase-like protein